MLYVRTSDAQENILNRQQDHQISHTVWVKITLEVGSKLSCMEFCFRVSKIKMTTEKEKSTCLFKAGGSNVCQLSITTSHHPR